jgi:hypothetical protein
MFRQRWLICALGALACGVLVLGGCASASFQGTCDPTTTTCSCDANKPCPSGYDCVSGTCQASAGDAGGDLQPDQGLPDQGLPDVGVDLPPKKGFGEACNDKGECATQICLFAGIGGVCSKLCSAGTCPDGYGCLGVSGAVEPGKVSDVCVPNATQLCSPCQKDTECSLSGADKCLKVDDATYCGRDCSLVSCPKGYACTTVDVAGTSFKQCLPQNGACDCDAKTSGTTKKCPLTTPFGSCEGFKTCQGLPGWGSCEPPQPGDTPDGAYTDENCDGIDGDIAGGIFVATGGTDDATCGATYQAPCLTINQGITRAKAEAREHVYIQAGTYTEVVVLEGGIHLWGGYDLNWQRAARTKQGHETRVEGKLDTASDHYITVRAQLLAKPTTVADMVLVGANASGFTTKGSRNSIVVYADTAAGLSLDRVTLIAGNGADGTQGVTGIGAPIQTVLTQMNGKKGGDASEFNSSCNTSSRGAGGAPGVNNCIGGLSPAAGPGGDGGTMDTCCDCIFGACTCVTCDCNATDGKAGSNATQWSTSSYGYRGGGGAGKGTCSKGGSGRAGRVQNGVPGQGGNGGLWIDGFWYAGSGSGGKSGKHGGGGGGGGGSGGCDSGQDSTGAGGGGGGAGGCAAITGGGGGDGGGGSFGLLADASSITLTDCEVQLGNGGRGGEGGVGGRGQSGGGGGMGGIGGTGGTGTGPGGSGGSGGHGGHGGGGGGGAGGISYGIFSHKSIITETCTFSGGSAGSGGSGGSSAPSAPLSERDGLPGTKGQDAKIPTNVGICSNTSSCP